MLGFKKHDMALQIIEAGVKKNTASNKKNTPTTEVRLQKPCEISKAHFVCTQTLEIVQQSCREAQCLSIPTQKIDQHNSLSYRFLLFFFTASCFGCFGMWKANPPMPEGVRMAQMSDGASWQR